MGTPVGSDHSQAAMGPVHSGMPEVVYTEVDGEGWSPMAAVESP